MKKLIKDFSYLCCSYLRLSKEDGDKVESDSIANQRDLIGSFLRDKTDITLVGEHIDDGITGTMLNRPGFQQMLKAIEAGDVSAVFVKDLSQLGRDYLKVGYYTEEFSRNMIFGWWQFPMAWTARRGKTSLPLSAT